MKIVQFPEKNTVYNPTILGEDPTPAHVSADGTQVTVCWSMNWKERWAFLWGNGCLWLRFRTMGRGIPPHRVTTGGFPG